LSSFLSRRVKLAKGETKLTGPDLAKGIPLESLPDGQMLVGHAHGKAVWCDGCLLMALSRHQGWN